jgi:hypothetical protein
MNGSITINEGYTAKSPEDVTTSVYDISQPGLTKSVWRKRGSDLTQKDLITLAVTEGKRAGNFPGVCRGLFKATRAVTVTNVEGTGNIGSEMIANLQLSTPIGTYLEDVLTFRDLLVGALMDDALVLGLTLECKAYPLT